MDQSIGHELDDSGINSGIENTISSSPTSSLRGSQDLEDLLLEELEDDDINGQKEDGNAFRPSKKSRLGESGPTEVQDSRVQQYCPPHPGYMGGICIRCGKTKEECAESEKKEGETLSPRSAYFKSIFHGGEDDQQGTYGKDDGHLSLNYIHHGLEVSQVEAARLKNHTVKQAMENKKLLLVLDLDHTLLHSTRIHDLNEEQTKQLHCLLEKQPADGQMLYHLPHMGMWTKLRPGIREFFSEVRQYYDLHVFTMGDKSYAAAIANLLDPSGQMFGGRVASSSDAGRKMIKDLDVLLGSDEIMLILDDTVGVWPRHKRNLIQVQRYIYFPACAVRFGSSEKSFLERQTDEDAATGALATCLKVLKESHKRFFAAADASNQIMPDIRLLLAEIRSEVLLGCCILFSRIIPKDVKPDSHPAWVIACQMGATCVEDINDAVTHVISAGNTSKTEWALKQGKYVVSIDWLLESGFCWKRQAEGDYSNVSAMKRGTKSQLIEDEETSLQAAIQAAGRAQ